MASNPPFQVEDQTDEDFFDKLVNDDDDDDVDFKVTTSLAVGFLDPKFADGNESDEAKAFANLSIGEVNGNENNANNTGFDDLGGEKGFEVNGDVGEVVGDEVKAAVLVSGNAEEISGSLVAGDSCGLDGVIKSNDGNNATEASSDCTMISKSSGSVGSGIKEVGWSAFTADSAQDATNGFGSYSDFFTELGENAGNSVGNVGGNLNIGSKVVSGSEAHDSAFIQDSNNYRQYQEVYGYGAATDQAMAGQDVNSGQYWENLYPGWKYDLATGEWYQVDGFDANANIQGSMESNSAADWSTSDGKSEVAYLRKTAESAAGTVAESGTTESVTNWNQVSPVSEAKNVSDWNHVSQGTDSTGVASDWNQVSQVNDGYPSHMVFDPQYPGWYYDTIAQEWRSLESYNVSAQSAVQAQDQLNQYGSGSRDTYTQKKNQEIRSAYGQVTNYTASQGFSGQDQDYNLPGSFTNYNQQVSSVWQPGNVIENESASKYSGNQRFENHQGQTFSESNHISQLNLNDYGRTVSYYEKVNKGQNDFSAMTPSQSFVSSGNLSQHFSQSRPELIEQKHVLNEYYGNQNSASFSQQHFQAGNQYSYAPTPGRSSAGRPPHALVTFGFGGKLILMKDVSSFGNSSFGNQNSVGSTVSVLNLAEVVTEKADASSVQPGVSDYFRALCQQSFPSPLTGGNVGTKELNKWIDERIASFESPNMDFRRGKVLKLLLSLLKIACQYYGKLRSPFGTDTVLKENDLPESAVAQLFATAKNAAQFSQYGAVARCLQSLASEEQIRATAAEVQSLLVSGRKKEALLCAQEGQLWGPALILAAQLGNQFYVDTVKQMALRQLVAGSPLRTLCLLIAGQPADVFSMDTTAGSSMPGAMTTPQQPVQQFGANSMLDCWEENLAVIASNRTKDDELVLIHLGDSLWKERSDIIAAHICYLVAEASFEPYSDSARLCLVGADHWKCPRTYASPEAIQRTEIYEYSMVLGNSQFILLPFQPYKLVYAHMLAEVGRMSDALKYCQAVLKSLKTGRAPEVETLRQSVLSLEERIKSHQQGGFSTNLAPAKLVGKLLNLFDSTANRVVGSLPPPAPSTSVGSLQGTEHPHQSMGLRVSTSQSTMAMSSLVPSASMEPISEWAADGNRKTMHTRSVSEPDFGRTPRQVDSSKDTSSTSDQSKAASRFGHFGFGTQLLQKTVGLVLRPRQDRQAKLGEKNKFYYDEKLKRWVEEGAEPPAEEAALPPPPPTTTFQNGTSDYNLKTALKSEGSVSSGSPEFKSPSPTQHSPGIPPLPPTSNQFSARGRMGVRSRYVDTFNQGGGNPTNLFQSPVPSFKPATGANPKFFVPSPMSAAEQAVDNTPDHSVVSSSAAEENPSASSINDSIQPPATPSSITMQRFGSMDNISYKGAAVGNSATTHSRRTASWSGSFNGTSSPTKRTEVKPLGEVLGMSPSSFMPTDSSLMHSSVNGGSFGDDLHEVEL